MLAAFEEHLGRAGKHLGGIGDGLFSGQTAGHGSIRQGFHEHGGEGRPTAGDAGGRLHQVLVQLLHQPGGGHQVPEKGLVRLGDRLRTAVERDPRAHTHGDVGHDAQNGLVFAQELLQRGKILARHHGHDELPLLPRFQCLSDLPQERVQHLGLHAEKQHLRALRRLLIGYLSASQLLRQAQSLFRAAICQQQL